MAKSFQNDAKGVAVAKVLECPLQIEETKFSKYFRLLEKLKKKQENGFFYVKFDEAKFRKILTLSIKLIKKDF